jgi:hypothetical protein
LIVNTVKDCFVFATCAKSQAPPPFPTPFPDPLLPPPRTHTQLCFHPDRYKSGMVLHVCVCVCVCVFVPCVSQFSNAVESLSLTHTHTHVCVCVCVCVRVCIRVCACVCARAPPRSASASRARRYKRAWLWNSSRRSLFCRSLFTEKPSLQFDFYKETCFVGLFSQTSFL